MNDSFRTLKKEKQNRIINAAMKIFAENPYNKASTDDIAALADISKGSLFYHFRNKRELYTDLYEYSCKKIYEQIDEQKALNERDFFERNVKIIEARVCAMVQYPYIFDFSLRAYYETDAAVQSDIKLINQKILKDAYVKMNENLYISKFKNKEDVSKAINMIIWIGEGFIKERRLNGKLNLKELQEEIYEYMEILKCGFYK